ncbi:MAG: PaaI family thioesterase [Myxococcota bacterium]
MIFATDPSNRDPQAWLEGMRTISDRTALGAVGGSVVAIDDEKVVLEMEISDASRQPFGLLHGGVSLLLAESAASLHSAWLADLSQQAPVGLDINGTHLSSAREGKVRVTARLVRKARTHVFHEVEVAHIDTGRLLCKARVTNFLKSIGPHKG